MSARKRGPGLVLLISLFTLGAVAPVRAQGAEDVTTGQTQQDLKGKIGTLGLMVPQTATPVALESTVNPEEYYVGPSDVLAVSFWTSPPLSYSLTVTPEGSLIIPSVGEVKVSDTTLAVVKQRVTAEIRKRYRGALVTVTLIAPRPIVVMVTGNVVYPGLYTLSSVDRAHRAIEQANTPARAEMRVNMKRIMADMSTRNVVLKRKDGRIFRVDIEKFLATRKDRWNPFLREGDVVIVPRKDESRNIVAIYGEVNRPGRYEFVQGDSLRDLLDIVNGFARHARTDSVEFYRFDENGTSIRHWTVNAGAIVSGEASDLALQPGDRVIVGSVPDFRKDYRATIVGEVLYPGTYPITKNSTRLSELVRRAGGVTASAALKSSYISRFHIPPRGEAVDTLLGERGRDETGDLNYYAVENILLLKQEYVSVNFSRLFGSGDSTQDVILQSDDSVFIATNRNTVYVYGQVGAPGHVEFMPGKDVDYYVKKVGGYLDQARTGEIKVVKAGSRQWISPGGTQIDEGDMIWVPKALERPFGYYLGIVAQAASILSVALSIVILSIQSRK